MSQSLLLDRKKLVNLKLPENLIAQAKNDTANLSATVENLLKNYVVSQQPSQGSRQSKADICAADWNTFNQANGSFADDHSTL
jgi:post-segregation antitoxin (ccd killing protein)